jgi:hypothetical protein
MEEESCGDENIIVRLKSEDHSEVLCCMQHVEMYLLGVAAPARSNQISRHSSGFVKQRT